jgi:hypothetical protein
MRKTFVGHYTPSEDEFAKLWQEGRIVVDANVLLAVYGLSPTTRDTLLGLFASVRDRLWIPNQFALEFQRNRISRILEQVKHYEDVHRSLEAILKHRFRSKTQHPFVPEQVERGLDDVCKNLLEGKADQEKLLTADSHFVRITELFEGKVGPPYNESDLNQAYDTARKRFSEKTPPGFRDSDKPEPARYGDYVGWRQILGFAKKYNVSVILVTDDSKDDWWWQEGSRIFGPRPELVVEFRNCCTTLFYMYSSDRFLELSEKYFGGAVDPKAVNELKERRESDPSHDEKKATSADFIDASAMKPVSYDAGNERESVISDSPKLTGQDFEKSEEK